ncbi:MAG TPA: hypothetical protein VNZ45_02825, partial [Bacteroidia bacterium]|nr:hypothetical protein [Bacteroidia bacterium]
MNSKKVYLGVSRKIFLVFTICLMGWTLNLKAQCYGVVQFDSKVDTGGATGTTFKITTANPNELILIGYNGWFGPGSGPVNVDGNPATHINTAHVSNSACAEVYCYSAPLAGVHTIVCTESGYSSPYYLNFAASFYVTGTCTPLSCADLITVETAVASGKVDTARITTTTPNEMIFCSAVYNTGIFPSNALIMSGVTNLGGLHEGNGIDASVGDTTATVAGTYTVATSDVNAAAGGGIVLVAIIPPLCGAALTLKDTMTNPTCNNNGIATDTPTGGTPPYTYLWSPGGNTNQTATGLSAGTYTVTVKDSVGCLSSATVTLTSNGPVVTAFNTKSVKCNGGADGEDSSSVKGGTSPYSYSWTPSGGTNAVTNGLSAGTYTITVTDKNGCTSSASASVTQPAGMTTSQVIVNNLCNGAANGKAVLSVSGGTGPYTYNWQPSGGSGSVATNLTAGTYTCTITDAGGCTTKDSATITQPPALKDTVTINPAVCGSNNGSASATASGGTGGYKYKWTPSGGTNASATGLSAGTYTITVTDANGCTKTTSVNISNIGGPSATSTKINVACNGGLTGSATAIATGGTSPYTYSWSPSGGTNATASGLSAGTYTCTV